MPTTSYGILQNDDGSFVLSRAKERDGRWVLASVRRWESNDRFKNFLLLHRGVMAAAPSFWKRVSSEENSNAASVVFARPNTALSPHAHAATLIPFEQNLGANLLGIVPDDAYLATVPRFAADHQASSFVSVDTTEESYKIGVVVEKQLIAVFTMAPLGPEFLMSHLARIERYCALSHNLQMPKMLFTLGATAPPSGADSYAVSAVRYAEAGIADHASLVAFGAALAALEQTVPKLRNATQRSAFRRVRAGLYAVSAALCLCTALAAGGIAAARIAAEHELDGYKKQYEETLRQNTDIRRLMEQNESLAKSILGLSTMLSNRTDWTGFLHVVSTARPQGLFFDMFGSETLHGNSGMVRIALSGWSTNESLVTEFISSFQKSGRVSDVSLSSLERTGKQNIVTFKVVCSLKLLASSQAK